MCSSVQVEMDFLLQLAEDMFHEGRSGPKAAAISGPAAPLINALVVNSKGAADEFWKRRGYVELKPDEIKARLGYRLDREETAGYLLTCSYLQKLVAPVEARCIGKRIGNSLGAKAALGKALAEHKKRGTSNAALLQAEATLSLAPPVRRKPSAVAASTTPADTPPPQP